MADRILKSLVLISLLALSGCYSMSGWKELQSESTPVANHVDLDKPKAVKQALYAQLKEWHGVPNRVGGLSKRGVDCSGFAYLTYDEYFGIKLPRSTKQQAQIGEQINKSQLKPGDLVFFRTGIYQRHVGMYTGDGKFIHASTSRGVMESQMDNPYWIRNYWKSVRVRL